MTVTSTQSDSIPVPCRTDETTPHHGGNEYDTHRPNTDRLNASMIPPPRDEIHDKGLDEEAIQTGRVP